jgi:hypothetical protein
VVGFMDVVSSGGVEDGSEKVKCMTRRIGEFGSLDEK